ncbi:hypothetical protein GCM10018952_08600 [Streptosporangium vulgare]
MAELRQVPLGELCEVTVGPSGSLLENLHEGDDGIPVLTPSDLTPLHEVETDRLRRLPGREAARLSRFALRQGDVLFVRQGALGRVAVIMPEHSGWLYNSSCLRLRLRSDRVLPAFLALYLSRPMVLTNLLGQAPPGTVLWTHAGTLRRQVVAVPPLPLQLAATKAVAAINAQIKAQRALLTKLEYMGPALFEEIFEDL